MIPSATDPLIPHGKAAPFRFKMASRRADVAPMVERIQALVRPMGFDSDQIENLAVALSEALSNAAVHGNRLVADTRVLIVVATRPHVGVVIDVRDSGPGFDVTGLLDCTDEERVLVPRGRGVFLMRHLVDSLTYNRRGNRVRLRLNYRHA
jgi:serine/threonine-protein kinase RsbW